MSYQFIILGILIILSAFFSGTETAFTSLSKIRIQHLLEQKKKGIKLVKALKDENERLIITILIGNNLVNIAASSIATSIAIEVLESNGIGVAIGLMTMIILIAGEIFPKTIAISKNEFIAINSAPVIQLLQFVLFPLIKSASFTNNLCEKRISMNFPRFYKRMCSHQLTLRTNLLSRKRERISIHVSVELP